MSENRNEIPVLLLTGYLGSGKTTLLNHILTNEHDIRFAVIVNDIGEVNIDAELIQKGGIVGQDDSGDLIALQNGCICCTLRADLMKQISDLLATLQFDYLVIEASGVCEPAPIAQTICSMNALPAVGGEDSPRPRLDCIATVADVLRLTTEFGCGSSLEKEDLGEDDIENLIIEQLEFCDIILLNKISEVSTDEAAKVKAVIRAIQPSAKIIECDYAQVDLKEIIDTGAFDFEKVATSATWVKEIEKHIELQDDSRHAEDNGCDSHHAETDGHHGHDHNHDHSHHHHHDGEGEADEYGIGTFVYFRRRPFNFEKFDRFVNISWPANVIRTKGVLYFSHNRDMSLLFEQAGIQKNLREAGLWYATAPEEELLELMRREPGLVRDWDEVYGDRMIKLVFIGRDLDRHALTATLDSCLEDN